MNYYEKFDKVLLILLKAMPIYIILTCSFYMGKEKIAKRFLECCYKLYNKSD